MPRSKSRLCEFCFKGRLETSFWSDDSPEAKAGWPRPLGPWCKFCNERFESCIKWNCDHNPYIDQTAILGRGLATNNADEAMDELRQYNEKRINDHAQLAYDSVRRHRRIFRNEEDRKAYIKMAAGKIKDSDGYLAEVVASATIDPDYREPYWWLKANDKLPLTGLPG
jgi:hypothetical protein